MNQEFEMQDMEVGKKYLLKGLRKLGYQWQNIIYKNNRKYLLIIGHRGFPNYFAMFKREPFFSFGNIFKNKPETGESINALGLQDCFKYKVEKIFVIYQNGNVYWQTPRFWAMKGFKRITDNEEKITYSISIHKLERWNLNQEKKV